MAGLAHPDQRHEGDLQAVGVAGNVEPFPEDAGLIAEATVPGESPLGGVSAIMVVAIVIIAAAVALVLLLRARRRGREGVADP